MLQNRPEPGPENKPVFNAFMALSARRGMAIGVGGAILLPLAFSEISVAADRFGFAAPDDFEHFLALISAMDAAYLAHVGKK